VVACFVVSGSDDFMVEVAAQDLADYERVLLDQVLAIPAVTQARTTFAIRTVLSRGPVPLTHWRS
jgi:Lrp/AsnC family leucine-responsive transcriptional regulator